MTLKLLKILDFNYLIYDTYLWFSDALDVLKFSVVFGKFFRHDHFGLNVLAIVLKLYTRRFAFADTFTFAFARSLPSLRFLPFRFSLRARSRPELLIFLLWAWRVFTRVIFFLFRASLWSLVLFFLFLGLSLYKAFLLAFI